MDYQYLNEFISLGMEKKATRHHKFNTDEIGWYMFPIKIRIRSRSMLEVGAGSGPKPDRIRNTEVHSYKQAKIHKNTFYKELKDFRNSEVASHKGRYSVNL
jgi:hypothetical protein